MEQYIIEYRQISEKVLYLANAPTEKGYIWIRSRENATKFDIEGIEERLHAMVYINPEMEKKLTYTQVEDKNTKEKKAIKQYIIKRQPVDIQTSYLEYVGRQYRWTYNKEKATRFTIEEIDNVLATIPEARDKRLRLTLKRVEDREKIIEEIFLEDYHRASNDDGDIGYAQRSIVTEYRNKSSISFKKIEELVHKYHTADYERKDIAINLNSLSHQTLMLLEYTLRNNQDFAKENNHTNDRALDLIRDYLKNAYRTQIE